MVDNSRSVSTENINEVILRLLRLKPGTELDYQTYFTIIKKKLAAHRLAGKELHQEEQNLLQDELKRIWKIKDKEKKRFAVKERKVRVSVPNQQVERSSETPPNKGTGGGGIPPSISSIVKALPKGKIIASKLIPKKESDFIQSVSVKDVTPKSERQNDILNKISITLDSILKTLTDISKQDIRERERLRRESESKKRSEREKGLESKTFDGLKKAISVVTKPFQSIWDRILNFIFYTLLGRVMLKLIDWFVDPKNKDKIKSLIRFVKDWWPALLGSYILFGTSFGKLVRGLTGMVGRFIFQIGKFAIPRLLSFISRNPLVVVGAITAGATFGAEMWGQKEEKNQITKESEKRNVNPEIIKSEVETAKKDPFAIFGQTMQNIGPLGFAGGGYASYGNLLSGFGGAAVGAGMGSMFGPMGTLIGAGLGGAVGSGMFNGLVSGPKGKDKVPAMLTEGEFVMSSGAVAKYGVETLESMNAAGGGTNVPKIVNGTTFAEGGGYIGDYMKDQVKLRPAGRTELTGESQTLRNLLGVRSKEEAARIVSSAGNKVPDVRELLGNAEFSRFEQGHFNPYSEGADEKTFRALKRIYQQHFGVGEEFSKMMSNRVDAEMLRRSSKPTSTPKPKPTVKTIPTSRMLPAAGKSSANAMRAAEKATRLVREPIPASRAIVPYRGGGLARTGVTAGLSESIPQIRTNMRVPGGFGSIKSLGIELLLNYLMQKELDYVEAKRLASTIEKAKKESPEKLANRIEKLRELVDKEERYQKSFGGILDKVIKLGGETGSEVLSRQARTILSGLGVNAFQGGAIKGGYGLKNQSFKDMPKTQVMTNDKGRPFIGYKAMRGGKPVYVRGPQPGTGTSNPLEVLGRMINPGAYKENDQRVAMKNQKIAMVNALESFQKQGMSPDAQARMMKQMGGNLKDVQNDLNYRRKTEQKEKQEQRRLMSGNDKGAVIRRNNAARLATQQNRKPSVKPLVRARTKPIGTGRGGVSKPVGGSKPNTQKAPSPSPRHRAGTRTTERTTGTKR